MRRLINRTTSVWKREEGFSVLLALLVADLFVAPLLKDAFPVLAAASTALSIFLFVAGAFVVAQRTWSALAVSVLAGAAIVLELMRPAEGADPLHAWRAGAAGLTIGLFAAVTLARVFGPGSVSSHRLTGAVVAYLLVGLTWAYLYEFLEALRPGGFQAAHGVAEGAYPPLLYYSFVTLTSVGYGDILPISPAARALSNLESLVGILYPAILIGRLLSMQGVGAPPEPPAGD